MSPDTRRRLVLEFSGWVVSVAPKRRRDVRAAVEQALYRERVATERMNAALRTAHRRAVEPVTAVVIPPDVSMAIDLPHRLGGGRMNAHPPSGASVAWRRGQAFLNRLLDERQQVLAALQSVRDARGIHIWRGFAGTRVEALQLGDSGRIGELAPARVRRVGVFDARILALENQLDAVGSMCRFMRGLCTHEVTLRLGDLCGLFRIGGRRRPGCGRVTKTAGPGPGRFVRNVLDRFERLPLAWLRIRSPDRTRNVLTWLPRLPADLGLFGQFGGALAVPPIAQLGVWGLVDRAERCPETGRRPCSLEAGVAFDVSLPFRVSLGWMPRRWLGNRRQADPTRREDVATYGTGAPFFDVAQDAFIGTKAEIFVAGHFYISLFRRPDGSSGVNVGILPKNLADIPAAGAVLSALADSYGIPGEWQRVIAELPFDVPDPEGLWTGAQIVFKPWIGLCVRHPSLGRPLHPPIALLQGAFRFLGASWRLGTAGSAVLWRSFRGRACVGVPDRKPPLPTAQTVRQGLRDTFKPFKSEWFDWAVAGLCELWTKETVGAGAGKVVVEGLGAVAMAMARNFRFSHQTLCFVSADDRCVQRVQGAYRCQVTRSVGVELRDVRNVEAVSSSDVAARRLAYGDACVVIVALHPDGIHDRATGRAAQRMLPIADALGARFTKPMAEPLLFVLLSNDRFADSVFMAALKQALDTRFGHRNGLGLQIMRNVRVSNCVLEQRSRRIDSLSKASAVRSLVQTEPDMEIVLERAKHYDHAGKPVAHTDSADFLGALEGVRLVANLAAHKDRKLFASNGGHLYVAVHAHLKGLTTIDQGMADPDILEGFKRLLDREIYPCLLARFPGVFSALEIERHREMLICRFADPSFADTLVRVGRDIQKKLGVDERLVGALICCLEEGIDAPELKRTIAAALHFFPAGADDPQHVNLHERLGRQGPEVTLGVLSELASQQGALRGPATQAFQDIVIEYYRLLPGRPVQTGRGRGAASRYPSCPPTEPA